MDYEDYIPESEYYDPEADVFSNMSTAEPWDVMTEDDWGFEDWVYEGEFVDEYDQY